MIFSKPLLNILISIKPKGALTYAVDVGIISYRFNDETRPGELSLPNLCIHQSIGYYLWYLRRLTDVSYEYSSSCTASVSCYVMTQNNWTWYDVARWSVSALCRDCILCFHPVMSQNPTRIANAFYIITNVYVYNIHTKDKTRIGLHLVNRLLVVWHSYMNSLQKHLSSPHNR